MTKNEQLTFKSILSFAIRLYSVSFFFILFMCLFGVIVEFFKFSPQYAFSDKTFKDKQFMADEWYIQLSSIESFGKSPKN